MSMYEKELEVAKTAARKAGKILLADFGKLKFIGSKSAQEVITNADYESEKKIISILRNNFPEYSILSEEAGKTEKKSEYMWVVDPLDGTTNYSINNPFFAISIALLKNNKPVLGIVYAPVTDELFHAIKGEGAYLNGEQIRVSEKDNFKESLMVYCHGYNMKDLKRAIDLFAKIKPLVRDFNRMRAGSLELAFVACGRVLAYISPGIKPWDVAAGALLVREAGGKVSDFEGNEWDLEKHDILATNGKVHERLLKIINDNY